MSFVGLKQEVRFTPIVSIRIDVKEWRKTTYVIKMTGKLCRVGNDVFGNVPHLTLELNKKNSTFRVSEGI